MCSARVWEYCPVVGLDREIQVFQEVCLTLY